MKDYKKAIIIDHDKIKSKSKPRFQPDQKPKKRLKKILILTSLLIVTILCIYIAFIREKEPEIVYTRYGRIADEFQGKGLCVRSESVYYAPNAGKVKMFVSEGERVAEGSAIAQFTWAGGSKTFYAQFSGVVSYQVDGLENQLKPELLDGLIEDYRRFRGKTIKISDGEKVNPGRPLFKLVDNFVLYMLIEVPANQIFRYAIGDQVWVSFDDLTIVGWVKEIDNQQKLFQVEMERFPNDILNKRWVDVTVLTNAYRGIIVPRKAITKKDDQVGVYVIRDHEPVFQNIVEIGGIDDEVVVAELKVGVQIVADPSSLDLDNSK